MLGALLACQASPSAHDDDGGEDGCHDGVRAHGADRLEVNGGEMQDRGGNAKTFMA